MTVTKWFEKTTTKKHYIKSKLFNSKQWHWNQTNKSYYTPSKPFNSHHQQDYHAVLLKMGHIMRKLVYATCEQQRRRSACASTQSDQHLCYPLPGEYNILFLYPKFQASSWSPQLSRHVWALPSRKLPKTGFLMTWLKYYLLIILVHMNPGWREYVGNVISSTCILFKNTQICWRKCFF